jgi:hypothetical protein
VRTNTNAQKWLERTPGIALEKGEMFWQRYTTAVQRYLGDLRAAARKTTNDTARALADAEVDKMQSTFDGILDEKKHAELVKSGVYAHVRTCTRTHRRTPLIAPRNAGSPADLLLS